MLIVSRVFFAWTPSAVMGCRRGVQSRNIWSVFVQCSVFLRSFQSIKVNTTQPWLLFPNRTECSAHRILICVECIQDCQDYYFIREMCVVNTCNCKVPYVYLWKRMLLHAKCKLLLYFPCPYHMMSVADGKDVIGRPQIQTFHACSGEAKILRNLHFCLAQCVS